MAINFKLGPAAEVDPAADDLTRTWVGWSPTNTAQHIYDQNRGLWLLGPRAEREQYATFSFNGTVRVVAAIERIETVPAKVPGGAQQASHRRAGPRGRRPRA